MSTLELFRLNLGVDGLVERIAELEKENARLVAEADRLRRLAERPVSWASPAGPCHPGTGQPAPGGAGGGGTGEIEV